MGEQNEDKKRVIGRITGVVETLAMAAEASKRGQWDAVRSHLQDAMGFIKDTQEIVIPLTDSPSRAIAKPSDS